MARKLVFVQACPDDKFFIWQVHVWLESLRQLGKSDSAISLIFTPSFREPSTEWKKLVDLYPEATWFFHKDNNGVSNLLSTYLPVLRPYMLMNYFKEHPEMKDNAVFYCDADIIFTENFNVDKYIDDDVCYLSDTNSYINASYFDSKVKDVLPHKLDEYKTRDVLNEASGIVGVNRQICEINNLNSGGAQYLLKNIDWKFWEKMIGDCIRLHMHLRDVNKTFFENENKGFQSWCSDMWALLWGLWSQNKQTVVVPEMDFAWSSDHKTRLERVGILHNAGIVSNKQGDIPTFYKGENSYKSGADPFLDPYLQVVLNDERSKTLCNHHYLTKMFEVKNKYGLNY
jgi:hypothetical protein